MIPSAQVTRRAARDTVPARTVERDDVINHVVAGLAKIDEPRIVFKGGTALRLCFFEDYRYSADLDFSVVEMPLTEAYETLRNVLRATTVDIGFPTLELDDSTPPRIRFVGPLGRARWINPSFSGEAMWQVTEKELPSTGDDWPKVGVVVASSLKSKCRSLMRLFLSGTCGLVPVYDIMQDMSAELTLDLPWVEATPEPVEGLIVRRGRADTLTYDDGIVLEVLVLDPGQFGDANELLEAASSGARPGRVVLVAGAVPVSWRPQLRDAELSFVDVSGVAEINWPRLHVSARRFGKPITRRRSPVSFQKGHALVAQELLIATADGSRLTIGDLAEGAGVSLSTASRAASQLAERGLVAKEREGHSVFVSVVDRVEIAKRLADRTAWPGHEMLGGYTWGRTVFDVAARVSKIADRERIDLSVTGRVGAAYYGVLATSSPPEVRCWVNGARRDLADVAEQLGLEPAPDEAANVLLSSDPWRVGVHRRRATQFDEWTATVAHSLRVWCDLHGEPRGTEVAAQMWGAFVHGE